MDIYYIQRCYLHLLFCITLKLKKNNVVKALTEWKNVIRIQEIFKIIFCNENPMSCVLVYQSLGFYNIMIRFIVL